MGYTHYFKKKKDISDSQWKSLCEITLNAFAKMPTHETREEQYFGEPIKLFDGLGDIQLLIPNGLFDSFEGVSFIIFNGDSSCGLDHETFVLRQKGKQDFCEWFCKTNRKPYDWFVTAVLILVYNICPGCYEISSDGDKEWLPVLTWLNNSLNKEFFVPLSVLSGSFKR